MQIDRVEIFCLQYEHGHLYSPKFPRLAVAMHELLLRTADFGAQADGERS